MSDTVKKILEEQEKFRNLTNSYDFSIPSYKSIQDQINASDPFQIVREIENQNKLIKSLSKPFSVRDELEKIEKERRMFSDLLGEKRQLNSFYESVAEQNAIEKILKEEARFSQKFRLPDTSEFGAFAKIAMASDWTHKIIETEAKLRESFARMRSPWVQIENAAKSVLALSELVSIGRGIDVYSAYDQSFVHVLRAELGDWRDVEMPSLNVLKDPILRMELYKSQGFNFDLTNFTPSAFFDGLEAGGLNFDEISGGEVDVEDEFKRAEEAYAILLRFEIAVRRFIEKVMCEAFGPKWIKQQIPPAILDSWKFKRDEAIKKGNADSPLIDYADFSDYKMIIEKKDNWSKVFVNIFGRVEDVKESFQRLYPIRISTMHSRIITLEDLLLLQVETKRVLKAICAGQ